MLLRRWILVLALPMDAPGLYLANEYKTESTHERFPTGRTGWVCCYTIRTSGRSLFPA